MNAGDVVAVLNPAGIPPDEGVIESVDGEWAMVVFVHAVPGVEDIKDGDFITRPRPAEFIHQSAVLAVLGRAL